MGVKHPLTINCQKIIKDTKRGGLKKTKKARSEEEETRKAGENMVTEDRLRCANIGSVCYSSIKPYLS